MVGEVQVKAASPLKDERADAWTGLPPPATPYVASATKAAVRESVQSRGGATMGF